MDQVFQWILSERVTRWQMTIVLHYSSIYNLSGANKILPVWRVFGYPYDYSLYRFNRTCIRWRIALNWCQDKLGTSCLLSHDSHGLTVANVCVCFSMRSSRQPQQSRPAQMWPRRYLLTSTCSHHRAQDYPTVMIRLFNQIATSLILPKDKALRFLLT